MCATCRTVPALGPGGVLEGHRVLVFYRPRPGLASSPWPPPASREACRPGRTYHGGPGGGLAGREGVF